MHPDHCALLRTEYQKEPSFLQKKTLKNSKTFFTFLLCWGFSQKQKKWTSREARSGGAAVADTKGTHA